MSASFWPVEHSDKLRELCGSANVPSASQMAVIINAEFGCCYSRRAILARAHRLNLKLAPHGVRFTQNAPKNKPSERVVDVDARHVPLSELERGDCRYPFGEGPFTFCGCDAAEGLPYCEPHMRLTHRDAFSGPALVKIKRLYRARAA